MAIAPLTHAMSVVSLAPILGALIGLGVGIDYALFIVTRYRRGLQSGLTPEEAAVKAIDTSGRAVLFAGITVGIALLGIVVLGLSFLNGLAVACALAVAFTMAAAVTLMPALLGVFRMRVLSRRQRRRLAGQVTALGSNGLWARWSGTVERRPAVLAVAAAAVMVILAIPVLSVRLGSSDQGNDPSSATTRQAYELLAEGFGPGFNGPLLLVAHTSSPTDVAALRPLEARLPQTANVASVRLLIPATAAVMNLLAAAATFGVLTAFFQWGWGTGAFGLGKAGPIEAYLPVLTLAILFGLSMDYQVFLVSRMNEEWVHGRDNRQAVRAGQLETARVITAAATIMICVFLTFSLLGQRDIAEFGIGLPAAVALDAFILRTVLVPALMHIFGDANWWLPRWLDRLLPYLAIEPPAEAPARPAPKVLPVR